MKARTPESIQPRTLVRVLPDHDPPGQKKVFIVPRSPDREVEIELNVRHRLTPDTLMALRGVPGVLDVREV